MREILGMPKACIGAWLGPPRFWSALLQYDNFSVIYESGINEIPVFDASIEIFSVNKSVKVTYDTPYVKGLPITLTIREKVEGWPGSGSPGFQERVIRRTYEDPYTLEFEAFYDSVVGNKPFKTTVADARNDLDIFKMIMKAGENNYHSF
jgi:predicted dehydrogenase